MTAPSVVLPSLDPHRPNPVLAVATRSGAVESWHRGAVAVWHGDALALAGAESRAAQDDLTGWSGWADALRAAFAHAPLTSPFAGADLIARGVPRGPAMGAALQRLEAEWAAADFPSDPAELVRILDKVAPAP